MSNLTWFLIGFLSASILCFAAAVSYYVRARNRVRSIEAAIHRYQESNRVVGDAVNQVYVQESPPFTFKDGGTKKFIGGEDNQVFAQKP